MSISRGGSFAARPVASKEQLRQSVRDCSSRVEFALPAVISSSFRRLGKFEAIAMRRGQPAEDASEMGQATSHSVLGVVARQPRVGALSPLEDDIGGDPHALMLL